MSSVINGNIQKGKQLVVECKILNELKQIVPLPRDHIDGFPW
jgi:hypothetical protein